MTKKNSKGKKQQSSKKRIKKSTKAKRNLTRIEAKDFLGKVNQSGEFNDSRYLVKKIDTKIESIDARIRTLEEERKSLLNMGKDKKN